MIHDVAVAGTGNAALCAALAAREAGTSVLVLEKAPESQPGTYVKYGQAVIEDRPAGESAATDIGAMGK